MLEGCVICNAVCVVLCNLLVASALAPEPQVGIKYEYDGLNRVTTCVDDNGGGGGGEGEARTEWDYDSLSRVVAERQNGQEVRSTWAVDSKRLGCVYPGGRTLSWSFDGVDHPRSVSDAGGVVASWEYEGRGTRVVSTAFRNGTGGEVGYDAVRRVTSLQWERGGAAFVDRGYGYNGVDFRTSETRFDDGGQRDDYVYDSLYRVVRTTLDQGGSGGERRGVEEIGYQLDGAGNRRVVAKAAAVGATAAEEAYEVNARNQYTSKAGVARTHDANGNLLQDETFSYGWDYRNRLVSVAVVGSGSGVKARYGWDCKNRRVRKRVFDPASGAVVRDVRFVWDAWRVCEEQDASGVALSTYVYGPRFLDEVCEVERSAVHPLGSGEVFLHQDVRFNVVAVTDAGGNEVERRYYDDYGNAVDAGKLPVVESAVGVELGFQGRRLDAETGLYYYRNRMYDPQTGRFLQTDPMWDAGNVGNPYTFCWSNPTSLFDAQGTFASLVLRTVISTAIKQAVRRVGPLVMQQVTDRLLTDFMERYDLGDFDLQTLLGDGALSQIITMSGDVTNAVAMDVYNAVGETFDNCFLAGTLVETTTRGRIPVEEVQEGDQIAPPPGHEGCTNPRCGRVEQLFRNTTDQVVTITAVTRPRARERRSAGSDQQGGGEDAEPPSVSQTIRCTPGHPFFVEGQGWVFAGDLREGDAFEARGERVVVANVEIEAERAQTFNFEVACHHTYFVAGGEGAEGAAPAVLVHNMSLSRAARAAKKQARRAKRLAKGKRGRGTRTYREVEFTDARGNPLGEVDQIRGRKFIERKSARGLAHPRNRLTPDQWAERQILDPTRTRIHNLQTPGAMTRPTVGGSPTVPSIEKLREVRRLHFQVEASTPAVQAAVHRQLATLGAEFPDWKFTAGFGN